MWRYLYDKVDNKAGLFDVKCTKALEDELIKLEANKQRITDKNNYLRKVNRENYRQYNTLEESYNNYIDITFRRKTYEEKKYMKNMKIIQRIIKSS